MNPPPLNDRRLLIQWTRRILREHGIRPSRKMGQSFVVNPRLIKAFIAHIKYMDTLEIGPGLGTLTYAMRGRARRLLLVELDKRLASALASLIQDVAIVNADALHIDWGAEQVASNTPFSRSSDIVVKLCRSNDVARAVLILQREVGERLAAAPGTRNYGRLSVIAQSMFVIQLGPVFGPSSYYPSPEVETVLVVMARKKHYTPVYGKLEELTRRLFTQRRRRIAKAAVRTLGIGAECLSKCLDIDKRVYEASPEELLCIAETCM